jgi:exosome complex component RRP4
MSQLKIKEKEVVVPGEVLAEGMDYVPSHGTYRQGDKILAQKLGLVNIEGKVIKLISLSGRYSPKRNDVIIGEVVEILMSGWRLEINCAYQAMLGMAEASSSFIRKGADLTKYFAIGDVMVTKVTNVTSQKLVDVSMKGPGLKKLHGGRVIKVNPHKVPRIIGKQGTMISMVKRSTGCRIVVGQNGLIWLHGEDPAKELEAVNVIKKIEAESHKPGLTEEINKMLNSGKQPAQTGGDQN